MACATLKRALELEELKEYAVKKMRWNYFDSRINHDANLKQAEPQPSTSAANSMHELTPTKITENIHVSFSANVKGGMVNNSNASEFAMETDATEPDADSDQAMFTFKQVTMICENMLREKEAAIREEYDQALKTKLAEQFDTFVKFSYDQIQKHYENIATYIS